MKRIVCMVLSVIFVLSLNSCAGIGDGAIYGNDSKQDDVLGEPLSADGWKYCYLGKSAGIFSSMAYPMHSLEPEDALTLYILLKSGDFSASAELIDDSKMMQSTGYFVDFTDKTANQLASSSNLYVAQWTIYSGDIVVDGEGKQAIIEGIFDMAAKLYEASEAATLAQEESYVIKCPPDTVEEIIRDTDCFVSTYTAEGEQIMSMECSPSMMKDIEDLLRNSGYLEIWIEPAEGGSMPEYLEVTLPINNQAGTVYRVYKDIDCVKCGENNMGVLSGAYDRICEIVGISAGSSDEPEISYIADVKLVSDGSPVKYRYVYRGYKAENIYELVTKETEYEPVSAPYTLPDEHVEVEITVTIPGDAAKTICYEVYSNGIVHFIYSGYSEVVGKNKELYGILKELSMNIAEVTTSPVQ